jgi:superfamily II DNA or RNA helicase
MSDFAPIECIVAGDIQLVRPPARTIEQLRRRLSFPNPAYRNAKRRSADVEKIPPRRECVIEEPTGNVRIPRGAVKELKEVLRGELQRPVFRDERSAGAELPGEMLSALERSLAERPLRYYQSDGIAELLRSLQGTIVIPCAGGKTTLGVASIGRFNRETLIIVHTQDLFDQWVEAVQAMLGAEPGHVRAGGEVDLRPVTIAMVISLKTFLQTPEGRAACARFGLVIVDEAHHSPSDTFQVVLPALPARGRLALTATPDREDGLEVLMDWSFGPRLLEIETITLLQKTERGGPFLLAPTVKFIESDFAFDYAPPEKPRPNEEEIRLAKLQKQLVHCKSRNDLIANIATEDARKGETVLILTNHKAHCRMLGRLCWERGVEPAVLISASGKAAKKHRKDKIQGMRDGNVKLAIATSLFDEGVDVTRLSRVVFALPEKARRLIQQRTGRLMRPFEGKEPILYDVVDPKVETLMNRAAERRRTYKRLGILR